MTHAEQHNMIIELLDFTRKMSKQDQDEFSMFVKRDKDDEDLDEISQRRLTQLYGQYVVRKSRRP